MLSIFQFINFMSLSKDFIIIKFYRKTLKLYSNLAFPFAYPVLDIASLSFLLYQLNSFLTI